MSIVTHLHGAFAFGLGDTVMGIFGAMTTAITGLQAQSKALEHISNNIANSQTTGYKRTETSFVDLVPDSPAKAQALGVVNANSRPTNSVQGDVSISDNETYMAINGDGYFIVGESIGITDGNPVFNNEDLYTRRGDFELDKYGHLVNGGGYYLKGLPIDPDTGNPSGSSPEIVTVTNDFLPAKETTIVDYRTNLASFPRTTATDETVTGSELLDPADFANDPTVGNDEFVQGVDATLFIENSISGGAVTAYDASGNSANVQFRWAKIDSVETGGTDTWNLFYLEDSAATGTDPAWRNVGVDYIFGTDGQLNPTVNSVTLTTPTINGVPLGDIELSHGAGGITQFADANGTAKITDIGQNGYAAGELNGLAVSDEGRIVANYSNGQQLAIAAVELATFNADGFLRKLDGGAFQRTEESGEPILGSLGNIVGSALESSNTDIADEFTKLIVTQQAYAANTRIVSTGDEMMQEAPNMIR